MYHACIEVFVGCAKRSAGSYLVGCLHVVLPVRSRITMRQRKYSNNLQAYHMAVAALLLRTAGAW